MNQIHLIDILHEVSGGIFSTDLERYIQIDIDDMFVGSEGTRIIKSDVDAMIEFQEKWDPVVPGVHFVIGFSGKFFQRSNNTMENQGDEYILGKVLPAFKISSPIFFLQMAYSVSLTPYGRDGGLRYDSGDDSSPTA